MKCLETRRTEEGYKRRRYQGPDNVRVSTIEVPLELWQSLQDRASVARGRLAPVVAREALRSRALHHMAEGWKAVASAHELGVPLRTIQKWRKDAATSPTPPKPTKP